jgi:hypothetical protein
VHVGKSKMQWNSSDHGSCVLMQCSSDGVAEVYLLMQEGWTAACWGTGPCYFVGAPLTSGGWGDPCRHTVASLAATTRTQACGCPRALSAQVLLGFLGRTHICSRLKHCSYGAFKQSSTEHFVLRSRAFYYKMHTLPIRYIKSTFSFAVSSEKCSL